MRSCMQYDRTGGEMTRAGFSQGRFGYPALRLRQIAARREYTAARRDRRNDAARNLRQPSVMVGACILRPQCRT